MDTYSCCHWDFNKRFYAVCQQLASSESVFQISRNRFKYLTNGPMGATFVDFALAKSAYENGISLKAIFIVLGSLGFPIALRTYFLMPKNVFPCKYHLIFVRA